MNKKDCFVVILIFVFTLTVGGSFLNLVPTFPIEGDSEIYDKIALNLTQNKGFVLGGKPIVQAPGYPFFLALVYYFFGQNYQIVRILQFFLLASIGIVIYLIALNFLKLPLIFAILVSLMVVIWPYFILYSTLLLTEILFIFFFLLSIFTLLNFQKNPSLKNTFLLGFFFGLASLVRPIVLMLPFLIFFFFLGLEKKRREKSYFLKLFLFLMVFVLLLTPWTIRNYFQFHKIILVSYDLAPIFSRAFKVLDYTQGSRALRPGETDFKTLITAKLKNIYLFWNPGAEGERAKSLLEKFSWLKNFFLLYKIIFFIIVALAFFSLKFIKRGEIFLFWMVIFYFWTIHIIFYPYPRYTLPIIPLVILLAFYTINYLSSRYILKYTSR